MLDEANREHMLARVPLGFFLSPTNNYRLPDSMMESNYATKRARFATLKPLITILNSFSSESVSFHRSNMVSPLD